MAVGAIIPVHGWSPYLGEALDAVLGEAPDVVVVVDDGSPHPLTLHPDHLAAGVSLVRREVCGGPALARAAGEAALPREVELVALCDADDAWVPGQLAALLAALRAEPAASWAFGSAILVAADGRTVDEAWPATAAGPVSAKALYAVNPVPTSAVLLRRSALRAAGGFAGPVRVAEDWELWLRLARGGAAAVHVPGAVVRLRRHPEALSADTARMARAQLAVHAAHAALVTPEEHAAAESRDLELLAAGSARRRR